MFRYLKDRNRGRVPVKVLLWRDMFVYGTVINLVFQGLAILTVYHGYPDWLAVVVFFLPMPFNIFLDLDGRRVDKVLVSADKDVGQTGG